MTIKHIKNAMQKYLDKELIINYDLGRNKNDILEGKIKELYNYIFTFELKNKDIRSFSYADIITETIKIIPK